MHGGLSVREYAKVGPKLWHGQTFKALRKRGPEGVIVGLYLMTSPSSNMLGLFNQPILYMAHETGLGEQGALKGLHECIEAGFCSYDMETEIVWVHEMAKYQIAAELKATDLRCKGIQKDYETLPDNPFLGAFFDAYCEPFHMSARRGFEGFEEGASKPPPKPLRSQEQEQEQEKEKGAKAPSSAAKLPTCPCEDIVAKYHEILPELPKVRVMDAKRKKGMQALWGFVLTSRKSDGSRRAETAEQALEWIASYFGRTRDNDFLMGRTQRGTEHASWKCDIDFLMTSRGLKHVLEKTTTEATT